MVAAKKIFPCIRLAILLLLTVGWQNLHAQTASKEYQVKAAFLYNFSQFVEWPPDAFPQAQSPLVIGILGDDPFGGSLDQIVSGEKVNGHPLVIQHYHSVGEIKACHILFISQSEGKESKAVLSALKGRDILTVSDLDDFTKDGGIIRFVTENNKIRFKINGEAAKAANLTLSSKLLRAAE
ncbi:MAG TPA: YfiR family protein [Verrucomicrobiae bacterium]|nr:YfiR family protein [Verrucomicrobiae bacterium]